MQTRAARELCARKTLEEKQSATRTTGRERWTEWVRDYLEQRHRDGEKTLRRYLTCWRNLEDWLVERGINGPGGVNQQTPQEFIAWRRGNRKGGRKAKRRPIASTTIALEMKVFRLVMAEAIRRGWAMANPCTGLGLSRKPQREMRALTIEEEERIREALTNGIPGSSETITQANQHGAVYTYEKHVAPWQPNEWMLRSFEIALAQGCRFSETRMPVSDITVERRRIVIRGKGGKVFETALNPRLIPILQPLIDRGEKWTWDLPPAELLQCARQWTRFFRRLGIADFWFHCTRATAITRAHEMGVSYPLAMKFFGHASGMVHAIYTRLGVEDVSPVAEALASYASTRCNRSNENAGLRGTPATQGHDRVSSGADTGKRSRLPSSR